MDEKKTCPACGSDLAPDRLEDLCPRCLLEEGVGGSPPAGEVRRAAPAPDELAPLFPGLRIEALVGQGGMGAVYRVRHEKLGRTLALKIVRRDVAGDGAFAERFLREARTLAGLSHPGIVAVHDFGESGGYLYLLMDHAGGGNLRALLGAGRLDPERAIRIAREVADAVAYAHEHGAVHRDVKPENILLHERGQAVLGDFGLVKLGPGAPDDGLTETRQVLGTPHYMAPEQVERPDEVGPATDVYSLGVVLYEMLAGRLPLGRFPPPSKVSDCSPAVDEVVLRALEQEPGDRQGSMDELATDLLDPGRRSRKRSPQASGASPESAEAATADAPRDALVIGCLGAGVFLASFLPWIGVRLNLPFNSEVDVATANAWDLVVGGVLPVWFSVVPGMALAVMGFGQAGGAWELPPKARVGTAVAGAALVTVSFSICLDGGGWPHVGAVAALVLYGIAIWLPLRSASGHGDKESCLDRRRAWRLERTEAGSPPRSDSVIVTEVEAGGNAARAGLRPGDVLLRYDGQDVHEAADLPDRTAGSLPSDEIPLTVFRDGRVTQLIAWGGPLGAVGEDHLIED